MKAVAYTKSLSPGQVSSSRYAICQALYECSECATSQKAFGRRTELSSKLVCQAVGEHVKSWLKCSPRERVRVGNECSVREADEAICREKPVG